MTHGTIQERVMTRGVKPAAAGEAEHPKHHAGSEVVVIALTDTDLQAVNGGGAKVGIGSGSNKYHY